MPRGLGLATATTSAAFFPHLERIRGPSSFSVTFQPTMRASDCGGISRTAPHLTATTLRKPRA